MSEYYLTFKIIHLLAMVSWFAGLFYLPRLFVYHAMSDEQSVKNQFKVMESKLYRYIMNPAAVITLITGGVLFYHFFQPGISGQGWLHAKSTIALLLAGYHLYCGKLIRVFAEDENQKSDKFYRIFNELPTLLLIAAVTIVILKPF